MKLTDEQREAIKWAVDRAHIAALGRHIAGVEAQRWLTLRVLLATRPAADAAVAPSEDHECVYENGDGVCRECFELA
ncbi:hypothetical protein C7408_1311, partial [Paraburkholderia caballeronis]